MAVILADVLDPEHVVLNLHATEREAALREIIARLSSCAAVKDAEGFLAAVLAREKSQSTFAEHGVAFPHARTDLVGRIVLAMGRSAEGVAFGDSGERAHFIFLIGVPQRMVTDYLVCVGALARLTRDPATRAALMEAQSEEEFVEVLRAGSLVLE